MELHDSLAFEALEVHRAVLPAALAFFQRARAMAESLAFAAALMVRLLLDGLDRFTLAHLFLAAAAIRARAAALMILPERER